MVIYTAEDLALEDLVTEEKNIVNVSNADYVTGDPVISDETSIGHFCDFVDFYTRHATNPLCTALTCEKQAEVIRITQQDLCPETIRLLIETMLTAIDHLEKKWLDEQIQREDHVHQEDVRSQYRSNSTQIPAKLGERQPGKYGIKRLWQTGKLWFKTWFTSQNKRASRSRSVQRRHITKGHITQREVPV
jgi:hypothetical protein